MAITQAVTTSFKSELLQGIHNFHNGSGGGTTTTTGTGNTFKIALYTSSATLAASTTAYATTNEVSGTNYTAGGNTLTNVVLAFGGDKTSTAGDFVISFPAADASNAIIRIA